MHLPILFQLREWNKEAEKRKPQNKSPSLFRCIVRMFGVQYALLGIIVFIEVGQIHTVLYLQCKPTFICDDFFSWSIFMIDSPIKDKLVRNNQFFRNQVSSIYACVVFMLTQQTLVCSKKKFCDNKAFANLENISHVRKKLVYSTYLHQF